MMKIIYTPETDHFRLSDVEKYEAKKPGDPTLANLRSNYEKLRAAHTLPSLVGIVTYESIFKKKSQETLEELKEDSNVETTSTYVPLNILRAILKLKDEDTSNALSQEFVYRTISYLVINRALSLDSTLDPKMKNALLTAPNIPHIQETLDFCKKAYERARKKTNRDAIVECISNTIGILNNMHPGWEGVQEVYDHILARFKANRVSTEFPLHFAPPGSYLISPYSVSLVDRIEELEISEDVLNIITIGARLAGENAEKLIEEKLLAPHRTDRFAETKRMHALDELLPILPEPKTIITDIYMVDEFPQLKDTEFEVAEFRLD